MTVNEFISAVNYQYSEYKDTDNAVKMAAYMKDLFPFYGIKSPLRAELFRVFWPDEKSFIVANFRQIVQELWTLPEREYQMLALTILGKCKKHLLPTDLDMINGLIVTKSWWDTVDFLASTCIGHILKVYPELQTDAIAYYENSGNMWLYRTALIFQLKYGQNTDKELLFRLIDGTFGSKEFFINKASGWALRQYSKYNPEAVTAYLDIAQNNLSKLTLREASKYL